MMMLRSATTDDLLKVASWIRSARDCEFWAGHALSYPLKLSTLCNDIGLSPHTSFCFADDDVQAFGQLIDKGNGRVHLAKIIVNPGSRGTGIGKKLVTALMNKAREQSFSVLGLNVNPENHVAVSMYEKLGFHFAERPAALTPSPGSLYMVLALAG